MSETVDTDRRRLLRAGAMSIATAELLMTWAQVERRTARP